MPTDANSIIIKKIKANFKSLGPKYNKLMKDISLIISQLGKIRLIFSKSKNFSILLLMKKISD